MKMRISKVNALNSILISTLFTATIAYFFIYNKYQEFEQTTIKIEKRYLSENRKLIKNRTHNLIKSIHLDIDLKIKNLKTSLKESINILSNKIIFNTQNSDFKAFLTPLSTKENYIVIKDNKIIYHSDSLIENRNKNRVINAFKNRKSEFFEYKTGILKKLTLSKYLKELDLNILIEVDLHSIFRELKKDITEKVRNFRYGLGDYGYFWIMNEDMYLLMHPISTKIQGDTSNFKSVDNKAIFDVMKNIYETKESGFLDYVWLNPKTGKDEQKISYIEPVKHWGWILGTGFYLSDLDKSIQIEKDELKASLINDIKKLTFILIILFIITLTTTFYVNRYIRSLEKKEIEFLNLLKQYKTILDESAIVSKGDLKGKITYVNDSFCEVSGYTREELIGKPHNMLRHPSTPKEVFKDMWSSIQAGHIWRGIIKNRSKTLETFYIKITIIPIKDENGNIIEYISARNNVTEIFEQKEHIKKIFNTDSLTSLGNRFKLINDLDTVKKRYLALIDIDNFRELNDLYGHKNGDMVIIELGNRVFNMLYRANYTIYRLESDTYAVLALDSSKDEFKSNIENLLESVSQNPFLINKREIPINVSAGISFEEENTLAYSDIALKHAKKTNKPLAIYNDSLESYKNYESDLNTINLIKASIEADKVVAFYQPIFNFHTNKIEKYECLIRIIDEKGETVPPFKFLEIAKKTRLYPKLTNTIVQKACEKFKDSEYEFSINLTIEDLLNKDTVDFVISSIKNNSVEKQIVIEIVESENIEDYDEALRVINKFKKLGCKIAIDDFGSGYSNFEYLIKLQANYVKIDGSIIKEIEVDESAKELVLSIIRFAKKSNMKVISEFVSSQEIATLTKDLGSDYAQGYFYGKPELELK